LASEGQHILFPDINHGGFDDDVNEGEMLAIKKSIEVIREYLGI